MGRIIIDHPDDVKPDFALTLVEFVIREGRVSECSTGKHYCWVTEFKFDKVRVISRQRKKGQTSDSFIVERLP